MPPPDPLPDAWREQALALVGAGYWVWEQSGQRLPANAQFCRQLGYPAGQPADTPAAWLALVHAEDRPRLTTLFDQLAAGQHPSAANLKLRLRHADGHWLWFDLRLAAAIPGSESSQRLIALLDISERMQVEAALSDSQFRYSALYNTSPLAFVHWDRHGHIVEWNRRAGEMFGWTTEQVIGKKVHSLLLPPDQHATLNDVVQQLTHNQGDGHFAAPTIGKDQQPLHCVWYNVALRAPSGGLIGILSLILDVTLEYVAEQELAAHRATLERQIHERTRALEDAHASLASIIDSSPVPTFVLDADHRITQWNRACEQIIGVPASRMIGTGNHWRGFYPAARPVLADLVMDGDPARIEQLYGSKCRPSQLVDGGYEAEDYFPAFDRWMFFTAAPLRDAQGRVIGAIETLQDVSERKRAELGLSEAMKAVEMAAEAKAGFLANMSHEIRTPMNAVIGLAHILLKTELTGKQRDFVKRINGAGQLLLGLINDILDFSKIDAGRMEIESTEFQLDEVLDNVATVVLHRAQEKGLELQYIVDPGVPPVLVGDPLRLSQILINLIGNAIKFTARGSVNVFFRHLPLATGRIRLEAEVQDTGIGITEEQQQQLFQAFSQADNSITRRYGGTGLGLTICKRLAQLMHGDIWVSSQPGAGSKFTFNIELGCPPSPGGIRPPTATRRALVVDDNPLARAVLGSLLEKQNCSVVSVESGTAALAALHSAALPYDLITIDLNMPDMDGLELAETIHQQITPQPRLVMVTAADTSELNGDAQLALFSSVLHKPVTAAQIGRLLAESPARPKRQPTARAPLAGVSILLVEDIPTNQLIARELLESLGATVETADNGRRAVDSMSAHGERYDLLLMDIQMPEMDGLQATRQVRGDPRWTRVPIIAMTANALEGERQRCLAAGMNDFITKPVDPQQLLETLQRWRTGAAASTPLSTGQNTMTTGDEMPDLPGIDQADGLKRMMNKRSLYEKILRDFHQRFHDEASRIENCVIAGDFETAARQAHSTKGLAGTIGAFGLQAAALGLEAELNQGLAPSAPAMANFVSELRTVIDGIAKAFDLPPPA